MRIGIDIADIARMKRLIRNRRFLERVFTVEEMEYCRPKRNKAQHYAVRFATKEAVWKALGKKGLAHRDIGVKNLPDGKPEVYIRGRRRKNIEVSLSHTDEYAVAVALVK